VAAIIGAHLSLFCERKAEGCRGGGRGINQAVVECIVGLVKEHAAIAIQLAYLMNSSSR